MFINAICVDFLYNAVIGILDYVQILGKRHGTLLSVDKYYPEIALTVSIISLLSFTFAFPVCFIQVTNALKNTTTHERFAYSRKSLGKTGRSSNSSMPSMSYIRSSEENMGPDVALSVFSKTAPTSWCNCFKSNGRKSQVLVDG